MKVVTIKTPHKSRKYLFEILVKIFGYSAILILMSFVFNDTIKIDNNIFGLYPIFASLIIFLLNKTIKPVLVILFLPITALTLGMFYPFINIFILKITSFILEDHFIIENNILALFIMSILISFISFIFDDVMLNSSKEIL
ncbi:MAG: phage holin family protein [Bacilli bacterium]